MKEPTSIVDQFLYPIEMAAAAYRGIQPPEKYQWMADLEPTELDILIEELQIKTEEALGKFFQSHRIEVLNSFELWLADRAEQEKGNVHPIDTIEH